MTAVDKNLPESPRRRGRPASTRAQDAIRVAARALFAEHGFTGTSIRDIASAAAVDPAIVMRHFGSKEALFLETISVDQGFRGITEGPIESLGRSILDRLVTNANDDEVRIFFVLQGASDRPEVRSYLARSTEHHIVDPLTARLTGEDTELRARLVAAQVTGLLLSLRTIDDSHLKDMPTEKVVEAYARALQTLIDG